MIKSTRINWTNFTKLRNVETNNIEAVICKSCKRIVLRCTDKELEIHRQVCQDKLRRNSFDSEAKTSENEDTIRNYKRYKQNRGRGGENDRLNELKEEDLKLCKNVDKALATFFFACNIPFCIVKNPFFLQFVRILSSVNFNYTPPSSIHLGDSVLREVNENSTSKKKKLMNRSSSVLFLDTWWEKSVNKKFIIFSVKNIHVSNMYLTYMDTLNERVDGKLLAKNIENAVKLAKEAYGTNIYAIVTESDAEIRSGARLAQSADGERLIQTTCSRDSANLLTKSFIDEDFMKIIKEVIHIFREPKFEALLNHFGGTKLKTASDSRFLYFRDTCKSILDNLRCLRQICLLQDINIREEIIEIISYDDFERKLRETINNLDPICRLINKCQDIKCNIADAVQEWLKFQSNTDKYNVLIQEKINEALNPVTFAANLLHHKYKGNILNDHQKEIGWKFLEEHLNDDAQNELSIFRTQKEKYIKFEYNCKCPISFWTWCGFALPNLSRFAVKLFLIPASTASIESLSSEWNYVHNFHRKNFSIDELGQFIDLYHSPKLFLLDK